MADQIKDEAVVRKGEMQVPPNGKADMLSVARRRLIKAGLTSASVVLTLKGRPLLGKSYTASIQASIAAGSSLHKK